MDTTSLGFYSPEDDHSILLDSEICQNAEEQNLDNQGAMLACLQAVFLQPPGNPGREDDLISVLYESASVTTKVLCDALAIDIKALTKIRNKAPISIYDCIKCKDPLPEVARRTHLCRGRTLRYLCSLDVGTPVKLERVCELLCRSCAQGVYHCLDQQRRADICIRQARVAQLRKMPLAEYLKTPEWRALRNRVLIQAGNRCQVCGKTNLQLDVHHTSYERYGGEQLSDLIVLCRSCHQHFHGIQPEAA